MWQPHKAFLIYGAGCSLYHHSWGHILIPHKKFEIWFLENTCQCRIASLSSQGDVTRMRHLQLRSRFSHQSELVMSTPQLSEPPATTRNTLNWRDILPPVTYPRLTLSNVGVQPDGAVKWKGLVTLSGDVWGFSQVEGEPQGAIGERGKKLEARTKRNSDRNATHSTSLTSPTHTQLGKREHSG